MTLDKNKLRKLLDMTTSSHDGEILNAIKLANSQLKENNLTWEDIINNNGMIKIGNNLQGIEINYDKRYAKIPQERRDIVGMIESLAKMHKYSREFSTLLLFASSKILWGNLTEKEYGELKKIFEKEMIKKKEKDEKWMRKYGIRISE
jgi:hypothetical protein